MELKVELICSVILRQTELDAIDKWNQESANKIYYVAGSLDDFRGVVEIVSENVSIYHDYSFNHNPTIKPTLSLVVDGNTVVCDADELDKHTTNSGSIVIGLMSYVESFSKEDFSWIKVKRFDETKYATLQEKYDALKRHHEEEVNFLINYIKDKK